MGIDGKYGRVTVEHGTIADDEPVVVFRAQDALLPKVLIAYHVMCHQAGSPERHLQLIQETMRRVEEWQEDHYTKTPSSDSRA
jgi:hypothetical protein